MHILPLARDNLLIVCSLQIFNYLYFFHDGRSPLLVRLFPILIYPLILGNGEFEIYTREEEINDL